MAIKRSYNKKKIIINIIKTVIGFILTSIIVIELVAFLERASYINFNYIIPTILYLIGFYHYR